MISVQDRLSVFLDLVSVFVASVLGVGHEIQGVDDSEFLEAFHSAFEVSRFHEIAEVEIVASSDNLDFFFVAGVENDFFDVEVFLLDPFRKNVSVFVCEARLQEELFAELDRCWLSEDDQHRLERLLNFLIKSIAIVIDNFLLNMAFPRLSNIFVNLDGFFYRL